MARVNIDRLSYIEMCELREELDVAIEVRHEEERQKIADQLQELAASHGYTVNEVFGIRNMRKPAKVKYRNPENPKQTWTGRGRKPVWLVECLENGSSLEEFII